MTSLPNRLYIFLISFLLLCFLSLYWGGSEQQTSAQGIPPSTSTPDIFGAVISARSTFTTVLNNAVNADVSWTRYTLYWHEIEEEEGEYDWSRAAEADVKIPAMIDAGLTPIILLVGTPAWAQVYPAAGPCGPIEESHFIDFAEFAQAVVERYPGVQYWEIWNEPDIPVEAGSPLEPGIGCWGSSPSPNPTPGPGTPTPTPTPNPMVSSGEYFGEMLEVVYPYIKDNPAPITDTEHVVLGGLIGTFEGDLAGGGGGPEPKYDFLEGILNYQTGQAPGQAAPPTHPLFDITAFHHYAYWAVYPTNSVDATGWDWDRKSEYGATMLQKSAAIRKLLESYDIDRPLFMNEGAGLCYPYSAPSPTPTIGAGTPTSTPMPTPTPTPTVGPGTPTLTPTPTPYINPLVTPNPHNAFEYCDDPSWLGGIGESFRSEQAGHLFRMYTRAWADDLIGASWYFITTSSGWRRSSLERNTNLPTATTPNYRTLEDMTQILEGAEYAGKLSYKPDFEDHKYEAYKFCDGHTEFRVYWTNDDRDQFQIPLPTDVQTQYRLQVNGEVLPENIGGEDASFDVTYYPVILERSLGQPCEDAKALYQLWWRGSNVDRYRLVPIVDGELRLDVATDWADDPNMDINDIPGSGAIQTQTDSIVGSTLTQAIWRGNEGYFRTVPVIDGEIQWDQISDWNDPPLQPTSIPPYTSWSMMQTQDDYVTNNTLTQGYWRGSQGYYRFVPISSGVIQWQQASGWGGPLSLSGLPCINCNTILLAQSSYVIDNVLTQTIWRGTPTGSYHEGWITTDGTNWSPVSTEELPPLVYGRLRAFDEKIITAK